MVFHQIFLGIALLTSCVVGDQLTYLAEPAVEWNARIQSIRRGNGLFLSPDNDVVVSTSNLGHVYAFDAKSGSEVWNFYPNATGLEFVSSSSGATFVTVDSEDYVIYSVLINELSLNPVTRVVAISLADGKEAWVSENLEGVASGNPLASEDGEYIFLNHNSEDGTVGHFTILDGMDGTTYFTQTNTTGPFSPPGIYHSPAEGYYDGGEFNYNDILVWSFQPKPDDITVGDGAMFAFQFPIGFPVMTDGIGVTQLGTDVKDFQAIQRPVFANEGRSLYWGTSRSQFRCWVGSADSKRFFFSRGRTEAIGFDRGSPARQAVFAPLALTHDETDLYLFGGTAAKQFVRLNFNFSDISSIGTTSLVKTEAHVSPDDFYVYYVEFNGYLHQASTDDLMDTWKVDLRVPVEGEFALSTDGTMLYVADVTGFIQALRVADRPTEFPTSAPTRMLSSAPSAPPAFDFPADTPPTDPPTLSPSRTEIPVIVDFQEDDSVVDDDDDDDDDDDVDEQPIRLSSANTHCGIMAVGLGIAVAVVII